MWGCSNSGSKGWKAASVAETQEAVVIGRLTILGACMCNVGGAWMAWDQLSVIAQVSLLALPAVAVNGCCTLSLLFETGTTFGWLYQAQLNRGATDHIPDSKTSGVSTSRCIIPCMHSIRVQVACQTPMVQASHWGTNHTILETISCLAMAACLAK